MTRQTGTTAEVLDAFVNGRALRTASAPVPGGCRVTAAYSIDPTLTLYSYRTAIAEWRPDGTVAVSLRRYTVTTSRLQSHLRAALYRAGYSPLWDPTYPRDHDRGKDTDTPPMTTIHAAVPGRWGGFGPAWHATGWENVPAEVWAR